jgi:GMP synthase-like glutamine amidotransferase
VNLGILKCDNVSDIFVAEYSQYPDMFANLLRPIDPTIDFTIFDVEHGEWPADIHAADAYLITGSRHGVNDGFVWINQLEEFIRTLYKAQKKVIGICFGHQLIAKALGGKVVKSPNGWGVGMSQNQIIQHKKWMTPYQKEVNLIVSHQDQVVELPQSAEVLATSDFCLYYMMQIGTNFFTVQGHPEFTKGYSKALMLSREDILGEKECEKGIKSLDLREDDALIAQWIMNFLKSDLF